MTTKNPIRVLVFYPEHKRGIVDALDGLEEMQRIVGGTSDVTRSSRINGHAGSGIDIVINDNGKGLGLLLNRPLYFEDGGIHSCYDVIAGVFFICRSKGENLASLTDEDIEKYQGWPRVTPAEYAEACNQ